MKKLLLLCLVLLGGVMQMSATNHLFAKLSSGASWWTGASAKTYVGSVEATTVTVWGETYYYWSFDTDQTDIQILRKSSDGSSQWNQTVKFNLTNEDKYIEILDGKTGDDQNINTLNPIVYLNDVDNNWGNSTTISQPFTKPNTNRPNHQTYAFSTEKLNKIRKGDYFFRFYANEQIQPTTDGDVISSSDYSTCSVGTDNAFKIAQAPNAKSVTIDVDLNNSDATWKWHVTAVVTNYDNTTVCYVNDATKTNLGNTVYAYAWDPNNSDFRVLGDFPGTAMTPKADGTFTIDVNYVDGMKIIFNNRYDGGGDDQTGNLSLAENTVYNFTGAVANRPVPVSAYKNATFSSEYPLDFTGVEGLTAYRITEANNGILTTEAVGKVPANTGLYIEGTTASKTYTVPTTATATAIGTNMMVAGTGETVYKTDGVYTNFILTTNKGQSATPKFYMVNSAGMTVSADKAYLQIPTATVNTSSRDFFWFDNETTGIDKVDVNANFEANAPMYNLAGQRVSKNYKGVVIQNGKKMLMK